MRKIFIILLSFLSLAAVSQTNTYSPYSRYGLGDLSRQGLATNKAMGGTAIALRMPNTINYLNPASYTAMDTLSFLFDFGMYSNYTEYKTNSINSSDLRASLDHIVVGFPITKWWKSSMGLVPYSRMGYDVVNYANLFEYSFKGTGGLNEFYVGNAFKLKDLSVGVNFNVIFGALEQTHSYLHESMTDLIPTVRFQQQSLRSTSFTFGLQYNINVTDNFSIILGGTYETKSSLVSKNTLLVTNSFAVRDSIVNPYTGQVIGPVTSLDTVNYESQKVRNHLPSKFGAGIALNFKNKLILSADYSNQKWSEFSFNSFDTLADLRYMNFGIQFTPDEKAIRSYWKRINLRAGFYTNETYLTVNSNQIKDYGLTLGLRFPFKGNRSSIQVSYEYGKRGTTDHNLIQENYHFVNLGITLYDFWFVKSKFN